MDETLPNYLKYLNNDSWWLPMSYSLTSTSSPAIIEWKVRLWIQGQLGAFETYQYIYKERERDSWWLAATLYTIIVLL